MLTASVPASTASLAPPTASGRVTPPFERSTSPSGRTQTGKPAPTLPFAARIMSTITRARFPGLPPRPSSRWLV